MLATQLDFIPQVRPEPFEYLDSSLEWGTFSLLHKTKSSAWAKQRSYKLSELQSVIESIGQDPDLKESNYWISQAAFNKFNRRKANLRSIAVCFVDLDYYTIPELHLAQPEKILFEYVFPLLQKLGIPLPSLVIDSGQGLQLKWFIERLPARALPRWDRLQSELCNALSSLGADANSKDASRVLRLQNTYNTKTGELAKVIWCDTDKNALPVRYEFNSLCDSILPFTQEQLAELRDKRKKQRTNKHFAIAETKRSEVIQMLKHPFARTAENLNWNRLHDLKKIVELRGELGDGNREVMAFYLCNFYALRYAMSGQADQYIWHEFYQLCKQAAPHWDNEKCQSKVNNVFTLMKQQSRGEMKIWNGEEVPMLYVPKNETMIDLFGITTAEQKHLKTIISSNEKQRRNTAKHEAVRRSNGVQERSSYVESVRDDAHARMKKVIKLTSQGFKQAQIAEFMGISVNAVKSLKKRAKSEL
ncbi:sigma-70 region 4 domain-containing protein [Photobacterium damselae]